MSTLTAEIVAFAQDLRKGDLFKPPGVAETIDWANALVALDKRELDRDAVNDTLGVVLKYQDDIEHVRGAEAERILTSVQDQEAHAAALKGQSAQGA